MDANTLAARLELGPEDVSLVARARPDLVAGCIYDDGALEGSEGAIQALVAYLGSPDWTAARTAGLDTLKSTLCASIDATAEEVRGRYITLGAGQAMTYQSKAAEAAALAQDADPDPAAYPLLAAEIGITGDTLADVGVAVRAAQAAWAQIGGVIEAVRLAGKAAVRAAEDATAARAAAAAVAWPAA